MNSGSKIPFSESGQFSRLFLDYVSGEEKLKPFYSFSPDTNGYAEAIASMRYEETNRPVLAAAIRKQYENSGLELPADLFGKISAAGTLTITTGHQLCLFTGPLYFIIKIATAIRLAEKIETETGRKIVPVYWMASEDHDFDEIASVNLFGKTIRWEKPGNGPVGRLQTDSLQTVLEELKLLLGETYGASDLNTLFAEIYRPGIKLAQATRTLVHRLFEGKVLVLDGDDADLKKLFLPFFRQDFSGENFRLVNESIAELEKLGYEAQVNPREINIFYTGENSRERFEKQGDDFRVLNTDLVFTKEALEEELKKNPAAFSPNVVLRPVYQQTILPNLVYVGGPGEIAYWLEYKKMFSQLNAFFPLLQPRAFAVLIDTPSQRKLEKLSLQVQEIFGEIEELIKKFVTDKAGAELSFETEKESLRKTFETIIGKAESSDVTLKKAAEAELQKLLNGLDALQSKMMRAQKQKQETDINQLRKLHAGIFPNGVLQERYLNFIPFYLQTNGKLVEILSNEIEFPVNGISLVKI